MQLPVCRSYLLNEAERTDNRSTGNRHEEKSCRKEKKCTRIRYDDKCNAAFNYVPISVALLRAASSRDEILKATRLLSDTRVELSSRVNPLPLLPLPPPPLWRGQLLKN